MRRTVLNFSSVALIIMVLFSTSCKKKYEDGPRFNLKSKAKRLSGLWKATKQVENGSEFLNNHTMELNLLEDAKDPEGKFNTYTYYTSNGSGDQVKLSGDWELTEDKEKLLLYTYKVEYDTTSGAEVWITEVASFTDSYTILRLTKDELWMEYIAGSYNLHLEFAKQ